MQVCDILLGLGAEGWGGGWWGVCGGLFCLWIGGVVDALDGGERCGIECGKEVSV